METSESYNQEQTMYTMQGIKSPSFIHDTYVQLEERMDCNPKESAVCWQSCQEWKVPLNFQEFLIMWMYT